MENTSQVRPIEPRDVWKRGLFMHLFAVAFGIGQMALNVIAIVQFLWLLIRLSRNVSQSAVLMSFVNFPKLN